MVYLNDIQDFETAAQELFKQQPLRTFCWIKATSFFPEGNHRFVCFKDVHPCGVVHMIQSLLCDQSLGFPF